MTLALTIVLGWLLLSCVFFVAWMALYAFVVWRRERRRPFRRLGYLDLTVRRRDP